jgi:hypothetical protein
MKGLIREAQQRCAQQPAIGQKSHTTVCKQKMTEDAFCVFARHTSFMLLTRPVPLLFAYPT